MKPFAAWFQLGCGREGRYCSNAWVSVPRRKRPSSPSTGEVTDGSDRSRGREGTASGSPASSGAYASRREGARGIAMVGSRGAAFVAQAGSGAGSVSSVNASLPAFAATDLWLDQAPHSLAVEAVAFGEAGAQAFVDEIVPAAVGTRLLAFEAGDVEPVARPRQRDVEQPVALLGLGRAARAWPAPAPGVGLLVPLTGHTKAAAPRRLSEARRQAGRAPRTAAGRASSRCRAGTRSAPRAPWRRARSSPAPRRGPAPCRA